MRFQSRQKVIAILASIALLVNVSGVAAQSDLPEHASANYGVQEYGFGAGGELDSSSANFEARTGVGDLGIGNSGSANFQQFAGFVTTDEPFIEFSVVEDVIDMGVLTTTSTATGTGTFSLRTYLAGGYTITVFGEPPSITGGGQIDPITSPAASSQGTEQFGLNLVANTSPATFGVNPVQIPDASFSFGVAAADYNTANQFKFVSGDTVATSPTSSGQTDFTASYIMNVGEITPAGFYVANQSFVATSTY